MSNKKLRDEAIEIATEIRNTYDDKYGYATWKIQSMHEYKSRVYMFWQFDFSNQRRFLEKASPELREFILSPWFKEFALKGYFTESTNIKQKKEALNKIIKYIQDINT